MKTKLLLGALMVSAMLCGRSQGADLIIMGSHGRTGLTRLLMGSVTERVIGLAPCPVMVVKPPGEAAAPLS